MWLWVGIPGLPAIFYSFELLKLTIVKRLRWSLSNSHDYRVTLAFWILCKHEVMIEIVVNKGCDPVRLWLCCVKYVCLKFLCNSTLPAGLRKRKVVVLLFLRKNFPCFIRRRSELFWRVPEKSPNRYTLQIGSEALNSLGFPDFQKLKKTQLQNALRVQPCWARMDYPIQGHL